MKRILIFFLLILGLILCGYIFLNFSIYGNRIKNIQIKGRDIKVEVVSTPEKLQKGLGGRKNLCENCGMLFVFPQKSLVGFWMKDMQFALDILWVSNGRVMNVAKNVDQAFSEIIEPKVSSDMVLEVNAGFCETIGIAVGDTVILK
jgi:uncharacterized protein